MSKQHRVVDFIVDQLAASGVEYIFGVDGANIEDLYDAAHFHGDVTAVLAKHEFSAGTMADGYSRAGAGPGRGLGVVMATSGGGSLNLVPALGESFASRVPVLALVGQPPTTLDGRGSFQDTSGRGGSLDATAVFSAVSVYCKRILTPSDIVEALPEAVAAARRGGPAVLLLPKDVQQGLMDGTWTAGTPRSASAPPADVCEVARTLRHTHGPVTIIAGEQVARDDARGELERLRALLGAQLATVPDAKDVSGSAGADAPWGLGVTGVMGHPGVADAVRKCAVCLLIGTRLSVTARAGLDAALAEVTTLSVGSAEPFVSSTHLHSDDLRAALAQLTTALSPGRRGRPGGLPEPRPRAELAPPPHEGPGIRYRDAMAVIDSSLPDGVDVVVDAGNTGAAAIHHLPVRRSGRFEVALGMGGMGYSFGAGIGMAFGRGRRTVVIAGDGAFFMHGMEIHTAVQYRLPITFVLFNNNAHAMCVTREQLFYDDIYSYNRFRPSRLGAGLAAMFPDLPALDVTSIEQLPAALQTALGLDGPTVVSVECSADEIPPFAPFLTDSTPKKTAPKEISLLSPRENSADVAASA
jgi:acetolactate synthase-1/2/3 large subunit